MGGTNGDCGVNGLIKGDEGLSGGGVESGDDGRTRKEVGIREVCPCCYCHGPTSVLRLDGVYGWAIRLA